MAFNLMSLLQAAAGLPEEEETEEVTVTSRQPKAPAMEQDPAPPPMVNRSYLEEAQAAREGAPKRKGMFGTKGTLRDILGVVSDAFLVQSGNKAQYQPRRDAEREADAFSGFTANPMAAMERLAATPGGQEAALKLFDTVESNKLRQSQIESMGDDRKSQIDERNYKRTQDFGNYAARVLQRANTPEKQAAAMELIGTRAQALGIRLEDLGIAQQMTPEQREVLASGDMTVNQQQQLPRRDRQLDISEGQLGVARQNAQSNRIRANRPPAGRAAPQPTNAAMAHPLLQKLQRGEKLTPVQAETLDRLGYSADRGKGRGGRRTGAGARADAPVEGTRRQNNRTGVIQTFKNGKWQ